MPKILSRYNDVKLVIGGKGPMLEELKQLAYNIGVAHKVYFTGYLQGNDVQRMYKCADIAVFPSTYEPFGIVTLEAMLAQVPVVVSDIGGLNEIVNHKQDGMKSYAGNANSIADSILSILFDESLKDTIVKNAYRKVRELFNWDKIADMTEDVYMAAAKKIKYADLKDAKDKIRTMSTKKKRTSILQELEDEKNYLDRLARTAGKNAMANLN